MAGKKATGAKRGRKAPGELSVKDHVLALFRKDPSTELDANGVVAALKSQDPKINEGSVRSGVAVLKANGFLIQSKREGRNIFLKLNPSPSPLGATRANRGALAGFAADLALLEQMKAMIQRYEALTQKWERLKTEI